MVAWELLLTRNVSFPAPTNPCGCRITGSFCNCFLFHFWLFWVMHLPRLMSDMFSYVAYIVRCFCDFLRICVSWLMPMLPIGWWEWQKWQGHLVWNFWNQSSTIFRRFSYRQVLKHLLKKEQAIIDVTVCIISSDSLLNSLSLCIQAAFIFFFFCAENWLWLPDVFFSIKNLASSWRKECALLWSSCFLQI